MARQSVKTVSSEPKSKREDRKRKRTGMQARLNQLQDEPEDPKLIVDSSGPPPVDGGSGNPAPTPQPQPSRPPVNMALRGRTSAGRQS